MIPAGLYYDVYLIFVLILSVCFFAHYAGKSDSAVILVRRKQAIGGGMITLLFTLFIGLRPISTVFVDMTQYWSIYNSWDGPFEFDWGLDNVIYDNLMYGLASIQFPPVYFYLVISIVYYLCTYVACKKMFPEDYVVAFIVFLGAFSSFSYATNGIKAGAAAAVFLLALAYRDRLKLCVPLMIVSVGIHHSMQLPVLAFFITFFIKNKKLYFIFWFFSVLIAAAHITFFQTFFANFSDETGAGYLLAKEGEDHVYITGFRPDFIIYSFMPVWMGLYMRRRRFKSVLYDTLLCVYLLTNGIWMLCMYASFTNRIAYLSWCIYPFVLIYPLLKEGKRLLFVKVASAHLAFTLFMEFVYYS